MRRDASMTRSYARKLANDFLLDFTYLVFFSFFFLARECIFFCIGGEFVFPGFERCYALLRFSTGLSVFKAMGLFALRIEKYCFRGYRGAMLRSQREYFFLLEEVFRTCENTACMESLKYFLSILEQKKSHS